MMRISQKEQDYVLEVLNSQFRSSKGSVMTQRLEQAFAEKFNVRFAIAHVNGTATLHAALVAAGVGSGDEVIVPPLTMASTSLAVLHANAVPIFADVDPRTFTLDPNSIKRVLTERTKAIMPVALYGLSADMDPIMRIAEENELAVIEDDAECFLGQYKGRIVGTIGHLSSFSFQSSKHMTSGEGGMLITNDEGLAERVRRFSSLGYAAVGAGQGKITRETIQDPNYARHISIGWNYRMPELCAAVALGQLERLEELVERRIRIAKLYAEVARGCDWLTPQFVPESYAHSYWTYVLKLEDTADLSWHDFRSKYRELGGDGIYAAWRVTYLEPAFRGLPLYPAGQADSKVQKYAPGLCPVAESLQSRLLQLKTNYMDISKAERQAEILHGTITYFEGRQAKRVRRDFASFGRI